MSNSDIYLAILNSIAGKMYQLKHDLIIHDVKLMAYIGMVNEIGQGTRFADVIEIEFKLNKL